MIDNSHNVTLENIYRLQKLFPNYRILIEYDESTTEIENNHCYVSLSHPQTLIFNVNEQWYHRKDVKAYISHLIYEASHTVEYVLQNINKNILW